MTERDYFSCALYARCIGATMTQTWMLEQAARHRGYAVPERSRAARLTIALGMLREAEWTGRMLPC